MNKMQRNAQETDPDKQTYGPAMREKVLALAARFDAVRGKGEELKAAIEPLAVEEARAKDAEERAAREAEEAAQLRQQEEARKAEEARAAAERAIAEANAELPKSRTKEPRASPPSAHPSPYVTSLIESVGLKGLGYEEMLRSNGITRVY